jgi:hypothetical protein
MKTRRIAGRWRMIKRIRMNRKKENVEKRMTFKSRRKKRGRW